MLSEVHIKKIRDEGKEITLKRNGFFIQENEVCESIGIVASGTLYGYFQDEYSNRIVTELYQGGMVITSYRSFLTGIPSPASIKAYTDAVIHVINKETYLELMAQQDWALIFKEISDELFINKCFKETSLVQLRAKERYSELISKRPGLEQLFPQYLIAAYLKIRPETLSRLKSLDIGQHKMRSVQATFV